MTTFKTLLVGAAVGALLAVAGVAAAMAVLNPTAADVATRMADQASDPNEPPTFYGSR
ncbi:hypothetical protein SAMN06264365_105432 [Actinoplanes regularis]|uniref:DUF2613 domain-containing protein n=1 Tax=Actinoplanes regularis TaxID=52697 RepID=A0A238Z4A4_9ACTN|nr:hypothetical protein SAMN06264365_105432 [Actinoplanes regularis]